MKRAAIYARFSTDMQHDRSISDQVALCRAYAERIGYTVAAIFDDRAVSGVSLHGRIGMQALLRAANDHAFDAVVSESLSRIGRDEEDRAHIRKRLAFLGIAQITPSDGVVSHLVDSIRAIVDSQQLDDMRVMIRRGLAGVVRDGRHAGGRAYGYRAVTGRPGELAIEPKEADVIREIFGRFVAGETPRQIAAGLNQRSVSPPRGRFWRASTINGNTKRGYGILQNELYAGMIVWNRVRMMRDPATGKRVSRPNPTKEWQHAPAPHLAIIDDATWRTARDTRVARQKAPKHTLRRPRHLLSGLLRCGCCGAGMAVKDQQSGRRRLICSQRKEAGACANAHVYDLAAIERLVLSGLKAKLAEPSAIAVYVKVYNEERQRLAGATVASRARLESNLAAAERELDRAVSNLIKDRITEEEADRVLPPLRAERSRLKAELAATEVPPKIIALHPAVIARYLANVEDLEHFIARGEDSDELSASLRALVDSVVIAPKEPGKPITVDVHGRLAALVGGEVFPEGSTRGLSMVAEEGLEPPDTRAPAAATLRFDGMIAAPPPIASRMGFPMRGWRIAAACSISPSVPTMAALP